MRFRLHATLIGLVLLAGILTVIHSGVKAPSTLGIAAAPVASTSQVHDADPPQVELRAIRAVQARANRSMPRKPLVRRHPQVHPQVVDHVRPRVRHVVHYFYSARGVTPVWRALAGCEAGGHWDDNTGNGFEGGLQFTNQTWLAYGGGAFAQHAYQASPVAQVTIGRRVLTTGWRGSAPQGRDAWPVCGPRVGLEPGD